ncbi:MAG: helix-turn-helix domain-containing protein [Mycobacteriales bacterium]|nr:helix-turn-helix domain-containing protein [Mycobacteriales bacterium]
MSTPYLESGRARQKQRTRDALVEAARRLIEDGDIPRVEDVAEASGISRTTAYRYFPTQAMLLAAAFPETTRTSLLSDPAPAAVEDRVGVVLDAFIDIIERTEVQQRAMLRLSLGEQPHELPLRQGRAIGWMTEALEPLLPSLGVDGVRRLAVALRSVSGIETRVWLADVAGLDVGEIRELQTWMVQALVATAAAGMPANSAEPS